MTKQEPARSRATTGARSPGAGNHYDAEAVPVRNAATVLIVDERPDLQVLMLKRNSRSVFVGDMWVFPGGAVDPADGSAASDARIVALTDGEASAMLGLETLGIAYWVAVLRETFEEAGVLAGLVGSRRPDFADAPTAARFNDHRHALNKGVTSFVDILEAEDLRLRGDTVHYVGRWLTPVGPPRRYDTRFFVTAMPTDQEPLHDDIEAVEHAWLRPADAIEASRGGHMTMMTPTLAMLARLGRFGSTAAALAAAASATVADDEAARIRYDDEGPDRILFPGDADYDRADAEIEFGRARWPSTSQLTR